MFYVIFFAIKLRDVGLVCSYSELIDFYKLHYDYQAWKNKKVITKQGILQHPFLTVKNKTSPLNKLWGDDNFDIAVNYAAMEKITDNLHNLDPITVDLVISRDHIELSNIALYADWAKERIDSSRKNEFKVVSQSDHGETIWQYANVPIETLVGVNATAYQFVEYTNGEITQSISNDILNKCNKFNSKLLDLRSCIHGELNDVVSTGKDVVVNATEQKRPFYLLVTVNKLLLRLVEEENSVNDIKETLRGNKEHATWVNVETIEMVGKLLFMLDVDNNLTKFPTNQFKKPYITQNQLQHVFRFCTRYRELISIYVDFKKLIRYLEWLSY
jgi:hypothetical protein